MKRSSNTFIIFNHHFSGNKSFGASGAGFHRQLEWVWARVQQSNTVATSGDGTSSNTGLSLPRREGKRGRDKCRDMTSRGTRNF